MIPWLPAAPVFPPLDAALTEPNGLLAAGGDLSPQRILAAYRSGIFPWYATGEPILWWSPDPRMVLFPDELKVSRSLAKTLRQQRYEVTLDRCFQQVIRHCAETPRRQQHGTWITPEMQAAYLHLHELGAAHSVEVWMDDTLAGGLYGLAIGRAFFGESMFAKRRDASKIALAHLCAHLQGQGFGIIDCQMETTHLASLGARAIPRDHFVTLIRRATTPDLFGKWHEDAAAGLYRQEPT